MGVPVWPIHTSWGASPVESWMDAGALASFKNIVIPTEISAREPNKKPALLCKGMVHPYIGYALRGVIWYQGGANRLNAGENFDRFSTLIRSWREQWKQGDFPFYFVPIAPFAYKDTNAAYLREAQLKVMQSVENTGLVIVWSEQVKKPVSMRYAFQSWTEASLFNTQGLPASSFRTDDW